MILIGSVLLRSIWMKFNGICWFMIRLWSIPIKSIQHMPNFNGLLLKKNQFNDYWCSNVHGSKIYCCFSLFQHFFNVIIESKLSKRITIDSKSWFSTKFNGDSIVDSHNQWWFSESMEKKGILSSQGLPRYCESLFVCLLWSLPLFLNHQMHCVTEIAWIFLLNVL